MFETVEEALRDLLSDDNVRFRTVTKREIPEANYFESRRPHYVLETTTEIPKPMAEVFPFFSEARNLALLTPPKMGIRITKQPESMFDGALIAYKLRVGSVPVRWTTRIEEWIPERGFVDSQVTGPYHCWWHEHSFHSSSTGVTMVDRVFYAPPLRILGRALNAVFIRLQLSRVFGYRNAVLRRRFGG